MKLLLRIIGDSIDPIGLIFGPQLVELQDLCLQDSSYQIVETDFLPLRYVQDLKDQMEREKEQEKRQKEKERKKQMKQIQKDFERKMKQLIEDE